MDTDSNAVITLPANVPTAPASTGPSIAQRGAQRIENLNYVALLGCILVSNAWFAFSVTKFT